jgi:cytidylate kinase
MSNLRYSGSVCISGLTASGKSTHSHLLAGEFGLTYVSGSQILLNAAGVSPIQPKDFWVTPEARKLKAEDGYLRIDEELLRIESTGEGYVFDTSTQPWRHKRPALCIWLESDIHSRVMKSIVSHRGRSTLEQEQYYDRIAEKDNDTISLCQKLYGIEIGSDLSPFDLVLDISSLIADATLDASLESIQRAHSLIRPAAAWYLTGRPDFEEQFRKAISLNPSLVRVNTLNRSSIERFQ